MKTELSRRTLLQIPLLAAVSAIPSISVAADLELRPWRIWRPSDFEAMPSFREYQRLLWEFPDVSAELYSGEIEEE